MKFYLTVLLLFVITFNSTAQIKMPSLSPKIVTNQNVGLAKITLEYGQPSKKGRAIFGSLIPYNKLWRTGANASTKITFNKEVSILNNNIPAGTYGLYTIPTAKEWTIIIHKNAKMWGAAGYKKENDLVRFKVPSQKLEDTIETLYIGFENFSVDGADLIITWGDTKVKIPVYVNSDKLIEEQINNKIINATAVAKPQTYFDAAQYYYQKNKDLKQALKWFVKAEELRPNAFWYTYYKAELAYKLGKKKLAKQGATKCLDAAKNSPSTDYGYIAKCSLLLKEI